jgi:penicillin-binding protein 1A
MSEFRSLMELLGLDRKKDESYEDYASRIRDRYGILVDRDALMEAAFEEAKKDIESDLIFSGHESVIDVLRRLHFNIDPEQLDLQNPEEFQIYRLSFTRLQALHAELKRKLTEFKDSMSLFTTERNAETETFLRSMLSSFYLEEQGDGQSRVVYTDQPWPQLKPLPIDENPDFLQRLEQEDVWVDGMIPSKSIDLLQMYIRNHFERLMAMKRYDAEVLAKVGDFRRLVNTLYVVRLARELGFSTRLDPVLSFPLGANAVSILEAAVAYQAMMTGKVYTLDEVMTNSMVPIITKIVDRQGKTLWEYEPKAKQVLSKRVSNLVTNILHLVMEDGTGRSARDAVHLHMNIDSMDMEVPVPTYGKTGTANRFTNSSFVGLVPGPDEGSGRLTLKDGYVIASYVGFDDNRPMKGKRISIYGASGALPLWIDTANAIVNSQRFKVNLQVADVAFDPQPSTENADKDLRLVPVSPISGLPLPEKAGTIAGDFPKVLTYADFADQNLQLNRVFEPIRVPDDEQKTAN